MSTPSLEALKSVALATATAAGDLLAKGAQMKVNASTEVEATSSGPSVQLTAIVPGVPFTVLTGTTNGAGVNDQTFTVTPIQANVAPVAEVRASGSVTRKTAPATIRKATRRWRGWPAPIPCPTAW